jgi:hypothetical protein
MGSFDQNSSYIPPFFAVFAQTLGQFPQNVGFCPDFLYIAHLGIPEIWAIARKDEFAQKSIFRCIIGKCIITSLLKEPSKQMIEDWQGANKLRNWPNTLAKNFLHQAPSWV